MTRSFPFFRKVTALALSLLFSFTSLTPAPGAYAADTPTAKDIDVMMEKLRSPDISYYEKKRLAAVIFVHQDVYRKAVILNEFPAKSPNVDAFLDYKSKLQADVAERMNMKNRNLTGENIKQPIIPFAYNNILSDDDVITGAGNGGKQLEKLYVESLDELVRERAGQPMTEIDRHRVDVNGLAWDMTQKGGLENYWHKEKYIQPQSGFANQQKLIEAGDKVKVMGFDENGKLVNLEGDAKKNAILSLTVDKPLAIGDMNLEKGTGSMSDYARMAEIHQVKFKGTLTPEQIATFIRNQKYTDRVFADFKDLAEGKADSFIDASNDIRKQTTALGVAQILEKEYGIKILNGDGTINFSKMEEAMRAHQNRQLTDAMPKMIGAVSANEAVKISEWLKGQPKNSKGRAQLRKQLALTYAPFAADRMVTIMADLEKLDIPAEDKTWIKSVLTNDAQQIRNYAEMMRLPADDLVKHLKIEGDNMRAVELLESMDGNVRTLSAEMLRRPGGTRMQQFLKSQTAKALNLDVMLDGTKGEKVMLSSMMLLAAARAYGAAERNDEGIKKAGMALFEMVPLVSAVLRFSEAEFKDSFKELAMDIFPPLALAQLALTVLNWSGNAVKNSFTESVWDGLVSQALNEMTDEDFVKTELKYYRLKDREAYFQYLEEVEAGFGRVAKLASLTAPEVDAIMSRHPEVKANDAALYACNYFEEFDVIGIRKSLTEKYSVEQIKSRFWAEGGPDALSSSASTPVQRRAAWLIMENLKIRAEINKQVLQGFIDRIEAEYNKRKKDEEEIDPNGILENTRLILKQMYEGAPASITGSEWAFPKLKDEYRRLLDYLKGYKADGKDELALKQEMQALVDGFRKFIADLDRATALAEEKAGLNLSGFILGGEKSQIPAREVLLADAFRVGIRASVQPKRAGAAWTVFYYLEGGPGGIKLLGQKTLSSSSFPGGGEGLFVIDESAASAHFQIARSSLKPDFENEGEYTLHPVLAFGSWSDPVRQAGYAALNDPSEYPDLFEQNRVAFSGAPVTVTIRKAKAVIKAPPVVYKNDKAKALVYLDVPEYAREETAESDLKLSGPAENILSKLDPQKIGRVSMDPDKPTETSIEMDEKAEEGTYYIEVKARLRGFPDEAQPLAQTRNFDFVNQNNPALGSDLTELLRQMQALEAQARAIHDARISAAEKYLSGVSEASAALSDALRAAGELEAKLDSLEKKAAPLTTNAVKMEEYANEASRAGEAAAEARSGAENNVLKICETAKSMSSIKDARQLEASAAQAREADTAFAAQKTLFEKELESSRLASMNAEVLSAEIVSAAQEIKKEKIDTGAFDEALQKARSISSEGESEAASAQADAAKLAALQDSGSVLIGQAQSVLAGIADAGVKTAQEPLYQQMEGNYVSLKQFAQAAGELSARLSSQSKTLGKDLAAAETKITAVRDRAQSVQSQTLDDQALTKVQTQAADAKAAYDAASIFSESINELGSNASVCLGEAEKILKKPKEDEKPSLAEKDCSQMPGTAPRTRDGTNEVYCGCLNNQTWDESQSRCVVPQAERPEPAAPPDPAAQVAQANCSMYPNTAAQWNAARGAVECVCAAGAQWNGFACITAPVQQVNCSMYPGTIAQGTQCVCPAGAQWNGSTCAVVQQVDCSMYPGTIAQGTQCTCLAGTQWNGSSCVSAASQPVDCSMYPGTVAQGVQCVCTGSLQWNGSSCVAAAGTQSSGGLDCSVMPNSTATYDPTLGGDRCVCNAGYTWGNSQCQPVGAGAAGNFGQTGYTEAPFDFSKFARGEPQTAVTNTTPTTPLPQAACPPGQVNSGGICMLQGGSSPSSGGTCPPGSISLLGVCSAT